jgi:hypothetical protein
MTNAVLGPTLRAEYGDIFRPANSYSEEWLFPTFRRRMSVGTTMKIALANC